MEIPQNSIKIVETIKVCPLILSTDDQLANQKCFHLSCFDYLWLKFPPTERIFFYEFNGSSTDFNTTILHRLEQSLALALSYYRPMAGHLTWPSHEPKPYILCSPTDSVSLVIAESSADFDRLSSKGNIVKAIEHRSYVPSLQTTDEAATALSVQITFFPGFGFSIGIAAHHAIVDGKSTAMFIKSWAYLCQNNFNQNPPLLPDHLAPFLDRTVIKDPTGKLDMLYLKGWLDMIAKINRETKPRSLKVLEMRGPISEDHVRATFDLSRQDINKLRDKIVSKLNGSNDLHLSSFTVTLAHAIVCFVKSKAVEGNAKVNFAFTADFRSRLVPPLPANYFGNCVGSDKVRLREAKDVVGEDGLTIVAKDISESIKNFGKYGYFERAEEVFNSYMKMELNPDIGAIGVAGSPKFELYGVDFGWGRPRKVDVVSIDKGTSFSMTESRDQSGGIEVGFVMKSQVELQAFASLFVTDF